MTDICFVSTDQSSITVYRKLKSSDEDYFILSVIGENNYVYSTQTYYTTVNSPKSNEEKITNGVIGLTATVAVDGRKQNKNLTIKLNNGVTEGADSVTYDGNTLKSLNITPEKLSTLRYTKLETNYNVDSLTSEGVYSVYYDAEHGIGTHLGIGWCYMIYVKPYGDGSLSLGNLQYVFSSAGNIFTRLKNPNSESWDPWCVINGSGDLSSYQKIIDNTLETTSNTVPGAINEILGIANSFNIEYFPYSLVEKSEILQGLSAGQRGFMALLFAPSINTTINKFRFLSTSNNSGAQIQLGLFSYEGNWSDAANTIPVQIVGEPVTHTITKGMNIVDLTGSASLNPDKMYFAVVYNVSGFNSVQFMARNSTLPAPSSDIVALVVEGRLKSNYTLSQLIDLRNVNGDATRQQLENPNYPQGSRTVPWFMLS